MNDNKYDLDILFIMLAKQQEQQPEAISANDIVSIEDNDDIRKLRDIVLAIQGTSQEYFAST